MKTHKNILQEQILKSANLGEEEKKLLLGFLEKRSVEVTESWKQLLEERKFEKKSGHAAAGVRKMLEDPENASLRNLGTSISKDIEMEL